MKTTHPVLATVATVAQLILGACAVFILPLWIPEAWVWFWGYHWTSIATTTVGFIAMCLVLQALKVDWRRQTTEGEATG